ncbi:GDSL-type esterase/lipase family protein [Mucilaginibacter sp. AK015]|uniref:GDSL-type esterase/lipase family protein n=1 Tax=Mucilaginibacter sp. AK015 TaxID=2723072 RepID=UPI00182C5EBB|nr:GDSL-type esterase/lipase family protein [Mucilaginibacter sp. AK015]MBB5395867.1 acyl-CoA thioesterase-1 [Mucilaginibacter sp. AK015]
MQNILFFGNSLTAGYGLGNAAAQSFPALIGDKINALGLHYQIINAGLSGDTTTGGLSRLDHWLNKPIAVFVLELGINDIRKGTPPGLIAQNLQEIVNRVKNKYPEAKLVLLGMEVPLFLGGQVAIAFNAIYPKLAKDNQMAFVPFLLSGVAGVKHLNLWDRLHPSAEG